MQGQNRLDRRAWSTWLSRRVQPGSDPKMLRFLEDGSGHMVEYSFAHHAGREGARLVSYKATAVKVMIASPSDALSERDAIRRVIGEWNTVHAEDRQMILMPV